MRSFACNKYGESHKTALERRTEYQNKSIWAYSPVNTNECHNVAPGGLFVIFLPNKNFVPQGILNTENVANICFIFVWSIHYLHIFE